MTVSAPHQKTSPAQNDLEAQENDRPKIPDGGWGWMVVFASLMLVLIECGIAFSYGPLYIEFFEEFGASSTATSWIGSLFVAIPLLTGPIMSALVDRFGCRSMTILGSLISTIGFVLSSYVRSIELMYVTFGILAALGFGLNYITAVVCIPYWFEKKRTFAFGLGACGIGIGTFLYAPLTTFLVDEYRWRGTLLILSGSVLNMAVCGLLMRDPDWVIEEQKRKKSETNRGAAPVQHCDSNLNLPSKSSVARKESSEATDPLMVHRKLSQNNLRETHSKHSLMYRSGILYHDMTSSCAEVNKMVSITNLDDSKCKDGEPWYGAVVEVLKEISDFSLFCELHFLAIALSTVILFAWFMTPYFFLADHMVFNNYTNTQASSIISVIGITNTIGMIALGWYGDRPSVSVPKTYALCLILCGISCSALVFFTFSYPILVIAGGFYGLTLASCFTFTPQILVELAPLDRFTTAYGLTLFCQGVGHLIGPPIAGYLRDVTGKWDISFHISGAWIIVAGILIFVIPLTTNRKIIGSGPVQKQQTNEKL